MASGLGLCAPFALLHNIFLYRQCYLVGAVCLGSAAVVLHRMNWIGVRVVFTRC